MSDSTVTKKVEQRPQLIFVLEGHSPLSRTTMLKTTSSYGHTAQRSQVESRVSGRKCRPKLDAHHDNALFTARKSFKVLKERRINVVPPYSLTRTTFSCTIHEKNRLWCILLQKRRLKRMPGRCWRVFSKTSKNENKDVNSALESMKTTMEATEKNREKKVYCSSNETMIETFFFFFFAPRG